MGTITLQEFARQVADNWIAQDEFDRDALKILTRLSERVAALEAMVYGNKETK